MADQEHTLLEAAKLMTPSRKAGVVQIYANSSEVLRVAPVINTSGKDQYKWDVEDDLPYTTATTGFRNVGSDFDATQGKTRRFDAHVRIAGGKIKVDEYIIDHSPASIVQQENMQISAFARNLTVQIFEGTGASNTLLGARQWMTDIAGYTSQVVNAGTTASGDILTLDMMDELIEKVDRTGNEQLYMNEILARRLKRISRGNGTTDQRMVYEKNQFGQWAWMYDGIPIVVMRDGAGANLLSTTEIDGAGTNSDTLSVYMISWGMEQSASLFSSSALLGANGVPIPKLTRENDGSNFKYERLTWYVGFAPQKPRCMARLRYLENAVS